MHVATTRRPISRTEGPSSFSHRSKTIRISPRSPPSTRRSCARAATLNPHSHTSSSRATLLRPGRAELRRRAVASGRAPRRPCRRQRCHCEGPRRDRRPHRAEGRERFSRGHLPCGRARDTRPSRAAAEARAGEAVEGDSTGRPVGRRGDRADRRDRAFEAARGSSSRGAARPAHTAPRSGRRARDRADHL